jgi:hypothetical protein
MAHGMNRTSDHYRGPKRPKLLPRALELLERAGYPTDTLDQQYQKKWEELWGRPVVSMDLDAYWGMPLETYLIRFPNQIDRAISRLGDPTPNGRR